MQYCLLVVHVHACLEGKVRYDGRVHVCEFPVRMFSEEMTSTVLAPFAMALLGLVVGNDLARTLGDVERLGLPQRKGIDRPGGPVAA